jgi:hypothetical protein
MVLAVDHICRPGALARPMPRPMAMLDVSEVRCRLSARECCLEGLPHSHMFDKHLLDCISRECSDSVCSVVAPLSYSNSVRPVACRIDVASVLQTAVT